jgi:hypothetical protein
MMWALVMCAMTALADFAGNIAIDCRKAAESHRLVVFCVEFSIEARASKHDVGRNYKPEGVAAHDLYFDEHTEDRQDDYDERSNKPKTRSAHISPPQVKRSNPAKVMTSLIREVFHGASQNVLRRATQRRQTGTKIGASGARPRRVVMGMSIPTIHRGKMQLESGTGCAKGTRRLDVMFEGLKLRNWGTLECHTTALTS